MHLQIMLMLPKLHIDLKMKVKLDEKEFKKVYYFCEDLPKPLINFCILNKSFECAHFLLDHPEYRSMVDLTEQYDMNILRAAFILGDHKIVQRLLEFQEPDFEEYISLYGYDICMNGDMALFNMWISDPRCNPSGFDESPLEAACEYGRTEMVKALLADERVAAVADLSTFEGLINACKNGHTEVVKLLLADHRGFDPSWQDNKAIKESLLNGHDEITLLLSIDPRVSIPEPDD